MFRHDSGDSADALSRLLTTLCRPATALTPLADSVERRADVDRLDHLGIAVSLRCWNRLAREAREGGIILSEPVEDPHQGVRIAWAWAPGQRLRAEVVLPSGADDQLHGVLRGCDWRVYHVGVQSRAADSLVAWLETHHNASLVRPAMPAPAMRPGTRVRFMHSQHTGLVEIVEPSPDPGAGAVARCIVDDGPIASAAAACRALLAGPELHCARLLLASCFESGPLVPWVQRALAGTPVEATGPPIAPWLLAQECRLQRGADDDRPMALAVLARRSDLEAGGEAMFAAIRALTRRCTRALLVLCPPGAPADAADDVQWALSRFGPDSAARVVALSRADVTADEAAAFRQKTAAIPYSDATLACAAVHAIRASAVGARPQPKLLAVDCDNTLWDGVCGEVGPRGIRFERHHTALQRRLRRLARGGVLVALVTKNAEADVAAVLREREADMALHRDDLAAVAAGWGSKVKAVRRLLHDHGFAEDSLAFVDDSPLECAEMATSLPAATVIPWPAADGQACLRLLDWSPSLAVASTVTDEDARRARMYAVQHKRREAESKAAGGEGDGRSGGVDPREALKRFFHDLGTSVRLVDIASRARADGGAQEAGVQRAAQLSWRTNQFNPLKRPWSATQLASRAQKDPSWVCIGARVKDRFGDYGLVGVIAGAKQWDGPATGWTAHVDILLLSCRALGRGVEHALLRAFVEAVSGQGEDIAGRATELVVRFEAAEGARNEPCWLFLVRDAGLRPPYAEPSRPTRSPSARGAGTLAISAMPAPGRPCLLRGPISELASLRLTADSYADDVLAQQGGSGSAPSTRLRAARGSPARPPLLEALLAAQASRSEVAHALCKTLTSEIVAGNAARRRRRRRSPLDVPRDTEFLSLGVGWRHIATRRNVMRLVSDRGGRRWLRHPLLAGDVRCLGASEARFVADEVVGRFTYTRPDLVPALRTSGAPLVLDVGANVGMFASHVLRERPRAQVLCIEPAPQLAPLLHATLVAARRGVSGGAPMMLDCAVGCDGDGATDHQEGTAPPPLQTTPFTYFPGASIVSGIGRCADDVLPAVSAHASAALPAMAGAAREAAEAAVQGAQIQRVPILPLGSILSVLGCHHVDLLKVDVEGSELSVIESVRLTQWDRVRSVVVEVHADQPGRLHALLSVLCDVAGFARVAVCEDGASAPVADRSRVTVYAARAEAPLLGPEAEWKCTLSPRRGIPPRVLLCPSLPPFVDAPVPRVEEREAGARQEARRPAAASSGDTDLASAQVLERTVAALAAAWNKALGDTWPVPPAAALQRVARALCSQSSSSAASPPGEPLPQWATTGFEEAGGDSLALLTTASAARAAGAPLPYRDGIGHLTLVEMAWEVLRAQPKVAGYSIRKVEAPLPPGPAQLEESDGGALSPATGAPGVPRVVQVLGPQRSPWPDLAHWTRQAATAELPFTALVRRVALRSARSALRSSGLPEWAAPLTRPSADPVTAWHTAAKAQRSLRPSEPQSLRLVALAALQLVAGSAALERVLSQHGAVPSPLCVAAHSAGHLAAPAFRRFSSWAHLLARIPTVLKAAAELGAMVDAAIAATPALKEIALWSVQGVDVDTVEAAVAATAGEAEGAVVVRNGPAACGIATTSAGAAALRACLEPVGSRVQRMEGVDAPYHAPALLRAIAATAQSSGCQPPLDLESPLGCGDGSCHDVWEESQSASGHSLTAGSASIEPLLRALVRHGVRWDNAVDRLARLCCSEDNRNFPLLLLDVGPDAPTAAASSLVKALAGHPDVTLVAGQQSIAVTGSSSREGTEADPSVRIAFTPAVSHKLTPGVPGPQPANSEALRPSGSLGDSADACGSVTGVGQAASGNRNTVGHASDLTSVHPSDSNGGGDERRGALQHVGSRESADGAEPSVDAGHEGSSVTASTDLNCPARRVGRQASDAAISPHRGQPAQTRCAVTGSDAGSSNGDIGARPAAGSPPPSEGAPSTPAPVGSTLSVDAVAAILLDAAKEAVRKASGRAVPAGALMAPDAPWSFAALTSFEVALACSIGSRRVNTAQALTPALWFASETPLDLAGRLVGTPSAPLNALTAQSNPLLTGEAVCVEGMACVLPGGINSPAELWAALARGDTMFQPHLPPDRAALLPARERSSFAAGPHCGGTFLAADRVAQMDAAAFHLTQSEAAGMDPQHRMCLQTAAEALQRAGVDTSTSALRSRRVGVFAAVHYADYRDLALRHGCPLPPGSVASSTPAGAAGVVSRWLGSVGPSVTVQAACASGLVAVHSAASALRQGECELAVVVAAQVNLSHVGWADLRASGVLSKAQCRPLVEGRDGMARGEGALVLVLGPGRRAARPCAPLAWLRSSVTAHAGPSSSLAAPSRRAQEELLRRALSAAGMQPSDVAAVEGHFTGTVVGDAVELDSLGAVFGGGRDRTGPLYLGASKAQFGHLEAASGLLGLVKACAALQRAAWHGLAREAGARRATESRPTLTSGVAWADKDPAEALQVAAPGAVRSLRGRSVVGVSGFGITGTLAHVLVEGDQAQEETDSVASTYMYSDSFEFWAAGSSPVGVAGAVRRWARQVAAVRPEPGLAAAASALSRRVCPRGMPWRACLRVPRSLFVCDAEVFAERMAEVEEAATTDAVEACDLKNGQGRHLIPGVVLQVRCITQLCSAATLLDSCLRTDMASIGPDLLTHALGAPSLASWRAHAAAIERACASALRVAIAQEVVLVRRWAAIASRTALWLALSGVAEVRLHRAADATTLLACAAAAGIVSSGCAVYALLTTARGGNGGTNTGACGDGSRGTAESAAIVAVGDRRIDTQSDLWAALDGRDASSTSGDGNGKEGWTLATALWLDGHAVPLLGGDRSPPAPSLAADLIPPPGWDAVHAWALTDTPQDELRCGERQQRSSSDRAVSTQAVLDCLAHVLPAGAARSALSATESFAAQGLDSFGAVELAALLSRRAGVDVDPGAVFDHPTPELLAKHASTTPSLGTCGLQLSDTQLWRRPGSTQGALVLGVGLRAPCGTHDVGSFWYHTLRGKRAPNHVPSSANRVRYIAGVRQCKLPAAAFGAFLTEEAVRGPGSAALGMSPTEYAATDPQHLLLLSCAREALEHAGLLGLAPGPRKHHGAWPCRVGVFVGVTNSDAYAAARSEGAGAATAHTAVGTAPCMAAGRIAHHFDMRGPAAVVDTSCSSSLAALHLAMRSLRAGECDAALVAGANVIADPATTVSLARARALSPTGACHTLGPADGYLRAEAGVAMILAAPHALPVLERAVSATLPTLGRVAGSAWSHDGRAAALTAPNGLAQEEVVRDSLRDASASPEAVTAVELHGTGTPLGDGIEVEALRRALGPGRGDVRISSTKAVWGHSEAAAGLLGAVAALCAQAASTWHPLPDADAVAPRLLRRSVSVCREAEKLQVCGRPTPLRDQPHALIGVSSFGMSGTNVHALFAPPPDRDRAARVLGLGREEAAKWPVSSPEGGMPSPEGPGFWDFTLQPEWAGFQPSCDRPVGEVQVIAVGRATSPQGVRGSGGHIVVVPDLARPPWEAVCALRTAIAGAEAAPRSVRVHALCPEFTMTEEGPTPLDQAIAAGTGAALRGAFLAAQREHASVAGSAIVCEAEPQDALASRAHELGPELAGLEPVVRWRRGVWSRLRLRVESAVAAPSEWAAPSDPNRTGASRAERLDAGADDQALHVVVVTGASGGLALRCCEALAAKLSRVHFIMCSRRGQPRATRARPSWEERWVQADLADEAGPAHIADVVRDALGAAPGSCLLGVLHASGVAEEASLRSLNAEAWERPLAAKAAALWALLRALDPVVPAYQQAAPRVFACSSVASCWGNRGFGAYSAANAVLDAAHRAHRIQFTPNRVWIVSATQFGAVGDAGMVADDSHRRRFVAMGTGGLPADAVAEAAGRALIPGPGDTTTPGLEPTIIARLDPMRTVRVVEASSQRAWPMLADLAAHVQPTHDGGGAESRTRDSTASLDVRTAVAGAAVAHCTVPEEEARRLLQRDETRLTDLGIDSLGAVELAEALSAALHTPNPVPHTLIYDHPSVGDAVAYLQGAASDGVTRHVPDSQPSVEVCPVRASVLVDGAACCLPGGVDSPTAFAELLFSGQRAPLCAPPWLWRRDAFPQVSTEAAERTGPSPVAALSERQVLALRWRELGLRRAEVRALSPQHRVALRLAVEAVVESGTPLSSLRGTPCGVFVACCSHEHTARAAQVGTAPACAESQSSGVEADEEAYAPWRPASSAVDAVGDAPALLANRVSHSLDLRGPSEVLDAACASGIVALHAAKRALRDGECDRAIVVGVNLLADPTAHARLHASGALSSSGRCDAFCGGAGYGRAEGGVAFLLRRADATPSPRSAPLATLCGTATGQCGRGASLTAPRGSEQQRVVGAALHDAGVDAGDVGLLVAHGTGTALGDAAEAQAASAALRGRTTPVEVVACKATVGHTEGCAGLVGVLHAVVALARGEAPPPPRGCRPAAPKGLEPGGAPLSFGTGAPRPLVEGVAGVSSFGFGGTLSHAVLAPPPRSTATAPHRLAGSARRVLLLPGQGQGARGALGPIVRAVPLAYTLLATAEAHISALLCATGQPGRVSFASHLVRGDGDSAAACVPDEPLAVAEQLALCTAQVVAVESLREAGVEWDCALGHSLGEVAAAVAAGALPWRGALTLALARARAIERCVPSGQGGLIAVAADREQAAALARDTGAVISCFNGPRAHVLSGPREVVQAVQDAARERGYHARVLAVTHAFHHPCLRPAQDSLKQELERLPTGAALRWAPLRAALASTATGRVHRRGERLSVDHFAAQVPGPVLFADAVCALDEWRGECGMHVVDLGIGEAMTTLAQRTGVGAGGGSPVHWASLFPRDASPLEHEVAFRLVARSRLGRGVDTAAGLWLTSGRLASALSCLGIGNVAQAEAAEQALDAAAASFLRSVAPPRPGTASCLLHAVAKYASGTGHTVQSREASSALLRAARRTHSSVRPAAALLTCVLESADALLRGGVTGREVLFPGGSDARVRPVYAASPRAKLLNAVAAAVLARESAKWGAEARIVELGAGTGATSQCVHHALSRGGKPCRVVYTLTDLGGRFVAELVRATERPPPGSVRRAIALLLDDSHDAAAATCSSDIRAPSRAAGPRVTLRSARVDMNVTQDVDGLASDGPLHAVVVANALHAARSVSSTLRALAAALAPGGLLVVREVMAPESATDERGALLDATFGLLDEWWRDSGRSVLLTPSEWRIALTSAGFGDVTMLPVEPAAFDPPARRWFACECIIVARRTAVDKDVSGRAPSSRPTPRRAPDPQPAAGSPRASPSRRPHQDPDAVDAVEKALVDAVGSGPASQDHSMEELGLDSLVSISAASALARHLGPDAAAALERLLPRQEWFAAHQTPASLVAQVGEATSRHVGRRTHAPERSRRSATATLLIVPHAGGVSHAFRHWSEALRSQVSVRVAPSPAELLLRDGDSRVHGATAGAASSASLDEAVAAAAQEAGENGWPLILFGHCLGGVRLLAALRRLGANWGPVLSRTTLVLSCCPAPWRLGEFQSGRLLPTAAGSRRNAAWAIEVDLAAVCAVLARGEDEGWAMTWQAMRQCGRIVVVRAVGDDVVDVTHGKDLIAAAGADRATVLDAPGRGHNWPLRAASADIVRLADATVEKRHPRGADLAE